MTTKADFLTAIYEHVGGRLDDKQELTAAAIAVDDEQAMTYQAEAFGRQLRSDLRALERKMVREVTTPATKETSRLPSVDWSGYDAAALKRMREYIIVDGVTYDTGSLSGTEGATVLETWAVQVRKGAATTLDHARLAQDTAQLLRRASEDAGRDVSAAEVWGWRAAA